MDHLSSAPVRAPRKAAFASWIGSAVEYYDFFIYGTAAAIVFGKIFFPSIDPKLGTVAAFATFGVGYVSRPIGAFFMGHIGDKFGRKRVLTMTLLLMAHRPSPSACCRLTTRSASLRRSCSSCCVSCRAFRRPASRLAPTR
jgi:MFS family permease